MSKAFALAGARLGYLAASAEITDALRVVRLPYHLSAVTQAVARVALRHADELLARVDDLRAERDRTVDWLREQGLEVADSDANYVLFGRFADRHAVWQGLLDRGVLIRETGPDGWLRVSIGTAAEMTAFRRRRITRGSPHEQDSTRGAGDQGVEGPRRARPGRQRPPRHLDRGRVLRPHADRVRAALADRPDRADRGRHPHRRAPHRRGHRDRARRRAAGGAGRQVRHPPLRRRAGAAGRGAGAGRRGRLRPPVLRARRRAGRAGVRHHRRGRRGLPRIADPARLRDARLPRPARAARPGAVRARPAPPGRGPVQGGRPGAAGRLALDPRETGVPSTKGSL